MHIYIYIYHAYIYIYIYIYIYVHIYNINSRTTCLKFPHILLFWKIENCQKKACKVSQNIKQKCIFKLESTCFVN